jgi:hypothetical protein
MIRFSMYFVSIGHSLGEGDDNDERLHGGKETWVCGRWWYKLAHVRQRWGVQVQTRSVGVWNGVLVAG